MNNQEAKFILQAYRPDGQDAPDALFAPALAQARQDPELGRWLVHEQALDRVIAGRMSEVTPPAGLRAAILAGARVSEPPARRFPRWGWTTLAAAAAVAVVASLAWLRPVTVDHATLVAQLQTDARNHGGHRGIDEAGMRAVHAMLAATTTRLARDFRPDLGALKAKGCRTLSVRGCELIEVCFVRAVPGRSPMVFHLYVGRRREFVVDATAEMPLLAELGDLSSAAWTDGERSYVLATGGGIEAVRSVL